MKRSPFALVACVLGACTMSAHADDLELARQAHAVLKEHCYRCHGPSGKAKGGFTYVLEREQLVARGKIVPRQPLQSELLQRIRRGEMPPSGDRPVPAADVAVLERWINAGAPDFVADAARTFVTDAEVLQILCADAEKIALAERPHVRYLTTTHLANAGLGERELHLAGKALSKLLNSLSWHAQITRPEAIAAGRTIYRIDLRHYQWNASQWERLALLNPYQPRTPSAAFRRLVQLTKSEAPVVRADWFIATASRPPLYYDFLQMPISERALERLLKVDVPENLNKNALARAGFNDSGVSKNNRIIERHEAAYGAYWRSYDFAENTQRQNIFEHPLGPNTGDVSFAHAGGEMIFNLPNGLHGYMLADARGQRLDQAPVEIVSDPKRPDQRVEAGLSCMTCHTRGLIAKTDQVRGHVEKNADAFAANVRAQVRAQYASKKRMQALIEAGQERYQQALFKAAAADDELEPVSAVTLRYEGALDLRLAAAEFGMTGAEFRDWAANEKTLLPIVGPLLVKGGTLQRPVFQEAFPDLLDALQRRQEATPRLVAEPFIGHTGAILSVALAPKGDTAASSSADQTVRLWDLAGGKELRQLSVREVTALAFTPSGRELLTAGADRTLRLWDATTGKELRVFRGHTDRVRCLAISFDGRQVVSGGDDGTVRLWDIGSGKELASLRGHGRPVTSLAFVPNQFRVVSAGLDGSVRVWDLGSGRELRRFEGHTGEVYAVAADGAKIASGGNDRTVRVWDLSTGRQLHCFRGHTNAVIQVAFAPDGRTILSGSSQYRVNDRVIRTWDLERGGEVNSFGAADLSVAALAFTADGKAAMSGGSNMALRLWNLMK